MPALYMSVKNFYPEKPILKYFNQSVEMGVIIASIKSLNLPLEVKRSLYVIVRNETGNGKSVVCGTNVSGVQADSGRWPDVWDSTIDGVCIVNENMTGKERAFVVFKTLADGLNFTAAQIQRKGVFIGENVSGKYYKGDVKTPEDLAVCYYNEWVMGNSDIPSEQFIKDFTSMYYQSAKLFF